VNNPLLDFHIKVLCTDPADKGWTERKILHAYKYDPDVRRAIDLVKPIDCQWEENELSRLYEEDPYVRLTVNTAILITDRANEARMLFMQHVENQKRLFAWNHAQEQIKTGGSAS